MKKILIISIEIIIMVLLLYIINNYKLMINNVEKKDNQSIQMVELSQ